MAEDRFGDLGGDREPRQSAAERLAAGDEAELAAERRLEHQQAPRPSSVYSWVVGIVFLLVIIVVGINSIPNAGEGLRGPERGSLLPEFAAPLATGTVDADVNVKRSEDGQGKTIACNVRLKSALNGCDLRAHPTVIVFAGTRGADCLPGLDRIERVRAEFPQVKFVGILIRMGRKDAAEHVRKRGWRFPVAYDRDGQLTNVYGVGVCPATVFARRGGKVRTTELGTLSIGQLRAQIRRIL